MLTKDCFSTAVVKTSTLNTLNLLLTTSSFDLMTVFFFFTLDSEELKKTDERKLNSREEKASAPEQSGNLCIRWVVLTLWNWSIILSTQPRYIMIILCNRVVKYYLLPLYGNVDLLFMAQIIFPILAFELPLSCTLCLNLHTQQNFKYLLYSLCKWSFFIRFIIIKWCLK